MFLTDVDLNIMHFIEGDPNGSFPFASVDNCSYCVTVEINIVFDDVA